MNPAVMLNELYICLEEKNFKNLEMEYWETPNSINFITDGNSEQVPKGIKGLINDKCLLDIQVIERKDGINILYFDILFDGVDFTQPTVSPAKIESCAFWPFPKKGETTKDLMLRAAREINNCSKKVVIKYKVSSELTGIIGISEGNKPTVLDAISRYLIQNNLIYSNGDIKIDKKLKSLYGVNTILVNESQFLETIEKNLKKIT